MRLGVFPGTVEDCFCKLQRKGGSLTTAPLEGDAQAVAALGLRHKIRIVDPAAPVIFLVHGRAGNFDVMWTFRRAIPDHYTVITPQAPLPDPIGGFSWWTVGEEGKREEGPAQSAAGLLRSFLERAIAYYKLTPPSMLAAGFSQGAGLLSVLLQRPDNPFIGAALLAGFVIKSKTPVKGGTQSILVLHGTKDEVVPIELAAVGAQHLRDIGYAVEFVEDPVGHKIGTNAVRKLTAWVGSFGNSAP